MIPAPGAHGGDGAAVARSLGLDPTTVLDLSMSLNPCAPDVRSIVARHLDALTAYPDPSVATRTLADALEVDPAL
jgi:histidinol-phosphate/aromatic aminotransferase/cobyric acid decarboxylase-like protein